MKKSGITNSQSEEFAKVMIFIRHVRNNYNMEDPIERMNAVNAAEDAFERALGKDMDKVYKSKTWKNRSIR